MVASCAAPLKPYWSDLLWAGPLLGLGEGRGVPSEDRGLRGLPVLPMDKAGRGVYTCVCVCVSLCERETDRQTESQTKRSPG